MRKILAITDIHMRSHGRTIIGLNPLTQFQNALSHAHKNHPDAEHLILMGDLTHSGHIDEFKMIKDAIVDYPIPITFMLGNHDRRDNFATVFPNIAMTPTAHLQTRIDLGDDVILCLDTLDGPPYPQHHHAGRLCADRLNWLTDQLKTCAHKRVSIFMHHPPHECRFCGHGRDQITKPNRSVHDHRKPPRNPPCFCRPHSSHHIRPHQQASALQYSRAPATKCP